MIEQRIISAGITHKNTNLEEREKLQFSRSEILNVYKILEKNHQIDEAVILVTCNRIEFYLVANPEINIVDLLVRVFKKVKHLDVRPFLSKFSFRRSSTAVKHLFRVVSGMESMIIGEDQILGQVKDAYSLACSVNSAGKYLHKLFHQAFRTGKRVRKETAISKGAVSVSGAAIDIIHEIIPDMTGKTVLVVGINSMTGIAVKYFARTSLNKLVIANRTLAKAQALAVPYKAHAVPLTEVTKYSRQSDIVFSSTSKNGYIFKDAGGEEYPFKQSPPGLLVDLAIPRDIDPAFRDKHKHILIDQDYIHSYIRRNKESREESLEEAEKIVRAMTDEYMDWLKEIQLAPIFEKVTREVEQIRRNELIQIISGKLNGNKEEALDIFSKRLSNRIRKIWIEQLRNWIHSQSELQSPHSIMHNPEKNEPDE